MAAIPRATIAEALLRVLTPGEEIVLTHLVVWLLVLVSGVFLALRFYAIWQRSLVLVLDDGLLAASLVVLVFNAVATSISLALSTGSSSSAPSSAPATTVSAPLLLDNVTRTASITASAWSKSAFAFSLLALTTHLRRSHPIRIGLLTLVALVNAVAVGGIIADWVRCRPIHRAWMPGLQEGSCWDRGTVNVIGIVVFALFAFTDICLVATGLFLVWSKDMRRSERIGVCFVASLGLTAAAAATTTATEISTLTTTDLISTSIRLLLTSPIEPSLTILAASLPALRLLRHSLSTPTIPLRPKISLPFFNHRRSSSSSSSDEPLTPLHPPPRPLRPTSSRTFTTTSTFTQQPTLQPPTGITPAPKTEGAATAAKQHADLQPPPSPSGPIKGWDYNFSYWNSQPAQASPPTVSRTPPSSRGADSTKNKNNHQQQQGQVSTPSTSSSQRTLHVPYPTYDTTISTTKAAEDMPPTRTATSVDDDGGWGRFWGAKRLTTLEEEQSSTLNGKDTRDGLSRKPSARRESPTLGSWSVDAETEFEYDSRTRRVVDRSGGGDDVTGVRGGGGGGYFGWLQSLRDVTIPNSFTEKAV